MMILGFLTSFSYEAGKRTVMTEAIDMNVAQYNAQTGQFEWKVQ